MFPAIEGVGKLANSMGTTKKPMVVSDPHHRHAEKKANR